MYRNRKLKQSGNAIEESKPLTIFWKPERKVGQRNTSFDQNFHRIIFILCTQCSRPKSRKKQFPETCATAYHVLNTLDRIIIPL